MAGPIRHNSKWWMQPTPTQKPRKTRETEEKKVVIKTEDFVEPNPRKPKYICGDCGQAYSSSQVLGHHFFTNHLAGAGACKDCTNQRRCPRHETYYNWNTKSRDSKRVKCTECSCAFAYRNQLRRHEQEDHPETWATKQEVFQCAWCPEKFTDASKYRTHMAKEEKKLYTTPESVDKLTRQQQSMLDEARGRNDVSQLFEDGRLIVEKRAEEFSPPRDNSMSIGFVLQKDCRMNLDFVLND